MPSFSFKPIAKPTKIRSHAESSSKYNIIVPNIEGTIFITIDGYYKVVIGDDKYDIASESYSCKGVAEIYEQHLINSLIRSRFIRSNRDRDDRDRTMYLPFTAGCSVKGNVVRHKAANVVIFKIKKVFVDVDCPIGKQALKFYRDNYKRIMKAIDDRKPKDVVVEDE